MGAQLVSSQRTVKLGSTTTVVSTHTSEQILFSSLTLAVLLAEVSACRQWSPHGVCDYEESCALSLRACEYVHNRRERRELALQRLALQLQFSELRSQSLFLGVRKGQGLESKVDGELLVCAVFCLVACLKECFGRDVEASHGHLQLLYGRLAFCVGADLGDWCGRKCWQWRGRRGR